MNIKEELTETFEILIVAWLKSGDENATNLAYSLAELSEKHSNELLQMKLDQAIYGLKAIADPVAYLKGKAEAETYKIDGNMAIKLSEDHNFLKELATITLKQLD